VSEGDGDGGEAPVLEGLDGVGLMGFDDNSFLIN